MIYDVNAANKVQHQQSMRPHSQTAATSVSTLITDDFYKSGPSDDAEPRSKKMTNHPSCETALTHYNVSHHGDWRVEVCVEPIINWHATSASTAGNKCCTAKAKHSQTPPWVYGCNGSRSARGDPLDVPHGSWDAAACQRVRLSEGELRREDGESVQAPQSGKKEKMSYIRRVWDGEDCVYSGMWSKNTL